MINAEEDLPHILVVDDDPDQVRLLVTALRGKSYRVSVALSGDQAYARAVVLAPSLIILDVRMPGRSGIATAHLLKANHATRHIPIFFLSAADAEVERVEGLRAGAVDYVVKPFSVDEVLERVRIHLALARMRVHIADEISEVKKTADKDESSGLLSADSIANRVATKFIVDHIDDPSLKSSTVAEALGVSMRHLNTVFAKHYDISVFEFIRRERMRRAALMLAQSSLSIAEISLEVGYLNSANFATEFKKFWGKSPTQLRNDAQVNYDALEQIIQEKFD